MRAVRFHGPGPRLALDEIEVPRPGPGQVLVKIGGAGVCHTDVHIRSGEFPIPPGAELPLTLGHENAGWVEEVGAGVEGLAPGAAVAVWGGLGCGQCRICKTEHEQCCDIALWDAGGGYADYTVVQQARQLLPLGDLEPIEIAPLADAGLTPYRAITKCLPFLYPGASVAVIGVGGLGHMALQIVRALAPAVDIIAIDVADKQLALASELGATHAVDARGNAVEEVLRLTGGEGAQAVLDFVGTDPTTATAAAIAARRGIIVLVGIGGGSLPFSFFGVRAEVTVTNSWWGSQNDFADVIELARRGLVRPTIHRIGLDGVNDAMDALERGAVHGRFVAVPG